jgi:hypothetical protein
MPLLAACLMPAAMQAVQPLIWLARMWTSSSVGRGTPPPWIDLMICWTPATASADRAASGDRRGARV